MEQQTLRAYSKWKPWILAARPKTLTAAVVPVVVATCLAHGSGYHVSWLLSLAALLSSLAIQIATNLINDSIDYAKGADTETRLGPKRMTQQGLLTSKQVYFSGLLFFAIAFFLGIPLIIKGGWVIAILLIISILSGYLYTGGPFPLAYHGLGDLFVILFFGLVSTVALYYVQTLNFDLKAIIAGLQVGFLCAVMIAINNLRDRIQDAKVNKKTLAVRLGVNGSRLQITAFILIPYFFTLYWYLTGSLLPAILPWAIFPLANRLIRSIWNIEPGREYNALLGQAALLHLLFGVTLAIGTYIY